MAYVILSLLVAAVVLLATLMHRNYTYWARHGVPYEKPLPVLGNMKGVGQTEHLIDFNKRIYKRFKTDRQAANLPVSPFIGLYFLFAKTVFVLNLELIKHILIKDFTNFHNRGIFMNLHDDPLSANLLALEDEEWRSMRHKLSPVFTTGKMRHMFKTIVSVAESLGRLFASETKQSKDGVLEMKELCARYTTDVIGTCAFGIECNCLQDANAIFLQKGRDLTTRPRHSTLVQTFIFTMPKLALKMRLKLIPDDLSEFFLSTVRQTVGYRLREGIKRNDFLDSMIELRAPDVDLATTTDSGKSARSHDGIDLSQGLTLEQMAAQVLVFFFAGFDTSSTIMTFCLYELALNLDIQQRLRAEIVEVLSAHGGDFTYEVMNAMTYLEQVLAEILRKYPVLSHIIRKSKDAYPVPGGQVIPADTTIMIPIFALHHDPEFYPDPQRFDPERFTPEAIEARPACAYLPFGEGPRSCIGMRFGRMQAKVGLIELLQKFKFSRCERTEIPVQFDMQAFVTTPAHGIYLRVEELSAG